MVFRDNPTPPLEFLKKSGDPFVDLAPHDLDFVRLLMRRDPVRVLSATGSSSHPELREAGVFEDAHLLMQYDDGALCSVEMSRSSPSGYDQRLEVVGTKGMISIGNPTETSVTSADQHGQHCAPPSFSFPQRFGSAFKSEVAMFVDVVTGVTDPMVSQMDACQVLSLALAGAKAVNTGQAVGVPSAQPPLRLRFIGNGSFGSYMRSLVVSHSPLTGCVKFVEPPYTRATQPTGTGVDMVWKDPSVQAVYICTPDATHDSMCLGALQAGKHVLVEKPLYRYPQVRAAAETAKRVLYLGFHRRHFGPFVQARQSILQGSPAHSLVINSADPVPADPNAQFVLYNSLIHDLDMITFLLDATKIQILSCTNGPSSSFVINARANPRDPTRPAVECRIQYKKESQQYVQMLSIDGGEEIGFRHTPVPGQTFVAPYEQAYITMWNDFASIAWSNARGIHPRCQKSRLDSYQTTFAAAKDALSVMTDGPALSKL